MSKILTIILSALLITSIVITPVYATRTIEITKDIGVKKSLLAKQLEDLKSYKDVFPAFVKSVEIEPNTNRAKFIVDAQVRSEADVQSTVQPDGTFVVEILSGDLKGSKIITKLKERVGFDGTPKGATTVKTTLILETSMTASLALAFINDEQISESIGNGFYELGEYVKSKHPNTKESIVNVDYAKKVQTKSKIAENLEKTPKLEAARALEPDKESMKFQITITQAIENFISTIKGFFGIST
jgi:hypothetical protein